MNVGRERQQFRASNKRLRRARRLYVYFLRHNILRNGGDYLNKVAQRMQERGLFGPTSSQRDIRFSIARYLWWIQKKEKAPYGLGWYQWCAANYWSSNYEWWKLSAAEGRRREREESGMKKVRSA